MRLTEKLSKDLPIYFAKYGKDEDETNTKSIIQKLGLLEDIEDELGIDLITLFKAFEIIKSFTNYQIVEVQGQWYLIQGVSFDKSPKIPITKEQAELLKEVLV